MDLDDIRRKRIRVYAEPLTDTSRQDSSIAPRTPPQAISMASEESAPSLLAFRSAIETRCAACSSHNVDLDALVETTSKKLAESLDSSPSLRGAMVCLRCAATTCLGCGDTCTKESGAAYHCAKGRLVCAWVLLCSFDQQLLRNNAQQQAEHKKSGKKAIASARPGPPSGVGYSGDESVGGNDFDTDFQSPSAFQGTGQILGGALHSPTPAPEFDFDSYFAEPITVSPGVAKTVTQPINPASQKPPSPPVSQPYPSFGNAGNSLAIPPWTAPTLPASHDHDTFEAPAQLNHQKSKQKQEEIHLNVNDTLITNTTSKLRPLVQGSEQQTLLCSMLANSSLLDNIAELLRNDSIEDVAARDSVYKSVIRLTQILVEQHTTAALITGDRIKRSGQDLIDFIPNSHTSASGAQQATNQSIAACICDLAKQSAVMIDTAAGATDDFKTKGDKRMLDICSEVDQLQAAIMLASKNEEVEHDWRRPGQQVSWQKEMALADVPDDVILNNHTYANEARNLSNLASGRARRLIKEITSLTTSLPEGIFVRHGSSRLDVMKILMTGAVGTPYENGLFEFDLMCPAQYPNRPPMMWFRTTGGGRAHFNPNLYPEGKVCLSLLGTWDGEPWDPKQSTLLQLFVSVRSLILTEEPICNEPGWEVYHGGHESTRYNRHIYPLTVNFAILDWLETDKTISPEIKGKHAAGSDEIWQEFFPGKPNPLTTRTKPETKIWAAIAALHFAETEAAITAALDRWVPEVLQELEDLRSKSEGKKGAFVGTGPMGKTLGASSETPATTEVQQQVIEPGLIGKVRSADRAMAGLKLARYTPHGADLMGGDDMGDGNFLNA